MPDNYHISLLTPAALDDVFALQENVLMAMPEEERYFLIPKTRERFAEYLSPDPRNAMLGGRLSDLHVSQLIMRVEPYPFEYELLISCIPFFNHYIDEEPVGLLQGVLITPPFQGKGLLRKLLHAATDEAIERGLAHLAARIVPANSGSLKSFIKAGFVISGMGIDPDDGRRVYYMHKPLLTPYHYNDTKILLDPIADFEESQWHFMAGYVGNGFDKEAQKFILQSGKINKEDLVMR